MRRNQKSKKPMIAGVLMIIAFILTIFQASGFFLLDSGSIDIEEELENENVIQEIDPGLIDMITNACGVLVLVLGIFLLIGGILAIKRIHWGISMLGAILGLFSFGPWFLGSLLSFLALIFLYLSKDEFKAEGRDEQPMGSPSFEQPPTQSLEESEEERSCPDCGTPMLKDKEYDTWYCENCEEYK
ncbi:MAG: hypothetical protein V5A66_03090 [Candidatus Thermoplasmatota archaeon]